MVFLVYGDSPGLRKHLQRPLKDVKGCRWRSAGCADRGSMQEATLLSHHPVWSVLTRGTFTPTQRSRRLRASSFSQTHQPALYSQTHLAIKVILQKRQVLAFFCIPSVKKKNHQNSGLPILVRQSHAPCLPARAFLLRALTRLHEIKAAHITGPVPFGTCQALSPSRGSHLRPLSRQQLLVIILNVMKR